MKHSFLGHTFIPPSFVFPKNLRPAAPSRKQTHNLPLLWLLTFIPHRISKGDIFSFDGQFHFPAQTFHIQKGIAFYEKGSNRVPSTE